MNWTSAGDLGDIVVAMCVAKHAAEKSTLLLRDDGRTKGIVKRKDIITPLVESQPYIAECRPYKAGDKVDWPSELFRRGYHSTHDTLMSAHARHAVAEGILPAVPDGVQPWLVIEAKPNGRVVINRTARYNNPAFPWQAVVDHYGGLLLFVGSAQEHEHFQNCFGKVDYQPTKDMLEVAQLIAGSALFIGNQSSAMTIAEGLKHNRIQETSLVVPDCIYASAYNAQYVATADVVLPPVGNVPQRIVNDGSSVAIKALMPFREVPRCGWMVKLGPHNVCEATPERTARTLSRIAKMPEDMAFREVLSYVLGRDPGFFRRLVSTSHLTNVALALQGAGITNHPVHDALAGKIQFIV